MINQYKSIENNNSVTSPTNNSCSGGNRSTSGKYLPKSSTCVKNSEELFSVTLILIVSQEIKKLWILPKLCKFLLFAPIAL